MLLIFQIALGVWFGSALFRYYTVERPAQDAFRRQRAAEDREMARDRERHARNAAAKAALEPELSKLEEGARNAFLCAWEDGRASLTRTCLAEFVKRYEWKHSPANPDFYRDEYVR
jgi:hypothetical protein